MPRLPALKRNIAQLTAGTRSLIRPAPGWFELRLVKHGPPVPARIWLCSHEPGNAENILDTGPYLVATIGDEEADPLFVWERGRRIAESEYTWRMAIRQRALIQEPFEPEASPREVVDLSNRPSLF